MKCPYCTTPNRDGRRFCSRCGVMLGWACPRCAFFNLLGEQHCGGCGVPHAGAEASYAASPAPEAAAQAASPTPTGRSAVIKEEITRFLKEQAVGQEKEDQSAPVSQDDIDNLFRR